jgi:hypothetical protein
MRFMMKMKWQKAALASLFMMMAGCGGSGGNDYLGVQRSIWQAKKPASYRYKLNYGSWVDSCNTMRVTVPVSGEPQVTMTEDCQHTFTNKVQLATTIEKVFELQSQMLSKAKDPQVAFDPNYGYPTRIYWSGDYNYNESLNITEFEVLGGT